jgi:hypothetical protein
MCVCKSECVFQRIPNSNTKASPVTKDWNANSCFLMQLVLQDALTLISHSCIQRLRKCICQDFSFLYWLLLRAFRGFLRKIGSYLPKSLFRYTERMRNKTNGNITFIVIIIINVSNYQYRLRNFFILRTDFIMLIVNFIFISMSIIFFLMQWNY